MGSVGQKVMKPKKKKKKMERKKSAVGSQYITQQIFGDEDEEDKLKHQIDIKTILKKNATETYGQYEDPNLFKDYDPLPSSHLLEKMKYLYNPYNKMHDLS